MQSWNRAVCSLGITPGLTWREIGSKKPKTGTEIYNQPLAAALQQKFEFSPEELCEFQVYELCFNSYIKVGDKYFRPAAGAKRWGEDEVTIPSELHAQAKD